MCFLLDKICSEEIVGGLSHLERLLNICTHRLLLHIVLHLLRLVGIVIELVHELVHALLIYDLQVLLACLLHSIHLSGFHIFSFDLPRDKGTTLLAALITIVQLNETVGICVSIANRAIEAKVGQRWSWHKPRATLNELVHFLVLLFDLLFVQFDVLALNERGEQARLRIGVLGRRGGLLEHDFLRLIRVDVQLAKRRVGHGLLGHDALLGSLVNKFFKLDAMINALLYGILLLHFF